MDGSLTGAADKIIHYYCFIDEARWDLIIQYSPVDFQARFYRQGSNHSQIFLADN